MIGFSNGSYLGNDHLTWKGGGEGLCFFPKKNILIPNVAEKNILILVEEKQIIWFRVFVIQSNVTFWKKISCFARQKN